MLLTVSLTNCYANCDYGRRQYDDGISITGGTRHATSTAKTMITVSTIALWLANVVIRLTTFEVISAMTTGTPPNYD